MEDKKAIRTQVYEVTVTHYDDGSVQHQRKNDGFNVFELLGVLSHTTGSLLKQLAGEVEPDTTVKVITKQED